MVNDVIYAPEVVGCLNDIIHVHRFVCDADCVGLEYISGLFVGELAAFDVIGVVCEIDLCAVVDSSAEFCVFFFSKAVQKGRDLFFCAFRGACVCRDVPGLSC